jgi:hypothetical protein
VEERKVASISSAGTRVAARAFSWVTSASPDMIAMLRKARRRNSEVGKFEVLMKAWRHEGSALAVPIE